MNIEFWKLSEGFDDFTNELFLQSIIERVVYVHSRTGAKGGSRMPQGQSFQEAEIGDYFYLTHGNHGIYLLGQFTGPANIFTDRKGGWLGRPFRLIKTSQSEKIYNGPKKWWAPNENSTFINVPKKEYKEFEDSILGPYFGIKLSEYGL